MESWKVLGYHGLCFTRSKSSREEEQTRLNSAHHLFCIQFYSPYVLFLLACRSNKDKNKFTRQENTLQNGQQSRRYISISVAHGKS